MQREVQIRSLQHSQALRLLEVKQLRDDDASIDASSRLMKLSAEWAIMHADGKTLTVDLKRVLKLATEFMYPAIAIRYPEVLASIKSVSDVNAPLTDAMNIDWESFSPPNADRAHSGLSAAARNVNAAVTAVQGLLRTQAFASHQATSSTVALSFSRPGTVLLEGQEASTWRQADAARSKAV